MRFCSLYSGSSGNSIFIASDNTKVLIDAGLPGKKIEDALKSIGEKLEEIDGIFIADESASSVDFARKLGVMTEGNSIVTDKDQQTNLKGLFAAGDCTMEFKQLATAVGSGALAGRKMIEYVRELSKAR